MRRLPIRWLLVGVSATVLLLPLLMLFTLQALDTYLVQETERRLIGQGVVIGEAYRAALARTKNHEPGEPRHPGKAQQRYTPIGPAITDLDEVAAPFPATLPLRTGNDDPASTAGHSISPLLSNSQIFNLSGVRVLDTRGCVVATSRGERGRCLGLLPEVRGALAGRYSAVLRRRVSDEPPPLWGSLSRRGDLRVYSALPLFESGQVIGVVLQSRTAETGLEWLWKQRRDVLWTASLVMLLGLGVSLGFARMIDVPLRRMAAAARDISAGKRLPAGMGDIPAPREIAQLGAALDTMTRAQQAQNKYIAEFAANVSHELKTPLTSINGAAELLEDGWETMDPEQRQRFLGNIRAASDRTARLVGELLRLARIENSDPPDTAPLRHELIAAGLRERYGDQVSVTVSGDGSLSIAEDHLESVLGNLVGNALRHRDAAKVAITLNETSDGKTELGVWNDGAAITPANQERLFERFFTTRRDQGGTGLGLAIVKAIVDTRKGSITVQSDESGTRFTVRL